VTGTLFGAYVAVGRRSGTLAPRQRLLRVRGTAGPAAKAWSVREAGQRTAVNLAGIEHCSHSARNGSYFARALANDSARDVRLELLPGTPRLSTGHRCISHAGNSGNRLAKCTFWARGKRPPGEAALAQNPFAGRRQCWSRRPVHRAAISPDGVDNWRGVVLDPLARRFSAKDTGRPQFLKPWKKVRGEEILRRWRKGIFLESPPKRSYVRTGWLEERNRVSGKNAHDKESHTHRFQPATDPD